MSNPEIQEIFDVLAQSHNIIICSGAGISVSCGIPDFRSKDVGIYHNLNCKDYGLPSSELLFDSDYFEIDPHPFYKYLPIMFPNDKPYKPSYCHYFIQYLIALNKVMRYYTMNIDGLDA